MNETPYDKGRRAAAEDIPADANPYEQGSAEYDKWAEGHRSVASAVEASQSEGT